MRALASCGAVVTRSAILATLVTLVGCGGSQSALRRPLVTDQTPLGTPRDQVRAWYAAHDWCVDRSESVWVPRVPHELMHPCKGLDQHRIRTALFYDRDARLSMAWVFVLVPEDRSPHSTPLSSRVGPPLSVRYEPGPGADERSRAPLRVPPDRDYDESRTSVEMSDALFDALAVELRARYGQARTTPYGVPVWKSRREDVSLVQGGVWIIETHVRRPTLIQRAYQLYRGTKSAVPTQRSDQRTGALADSEINRVDARRSTPR
jgi:hypothetical protein